MNKIIMYAAMAIFFFWVIVPAYADHNVTLPGYKADRQYNQKSCEDWTEQVLTNNGRTMETIRGQWLGHVEGCRMGDWIYEEYNIRPAPKELEA